MRTSWLTAAAVVLVAGGLAAQQPTFKSGAKTVAVFATVTAGGQLVTGLARDEFRSHATTARRSRSPSSRPTSSRSQSSSCSTAAAACGATCGWSKQRPRRSSAQMLPPDKAKIGSFAENVQIDPENFTSEQGGVGRDPADASAAKGTDTAVERHRPGRRRPSSHRMAAASCWSSPTAPTIPETSA